MTGSLDLMMLTSFPTNHTFTCSINGYARIDRDFRKVKLSVKKNDVPIKCTSSYSKGYVSRNLGKRQYFDPCAS